MKLFGTLPSQQLLPKHDAGHNEAPVGCRPRREGVGAGITQDVAEGRGPST